LRNCGSDSFTSTEGAALWSCLDENTNDTTDCPNRVTVVAALKAKKTEAGNPDIEVNPVNNEDD
jgi:hypothetical protein